MTDFQQFTTDRLIRISEQSRNEWPATIERAAEFAAENPEHALALANMPNVMRVAFDLSRQTGKEAQQGKTVALGLINQIMAAPEAMTAFLLTQGPAFKELYGQLHSEKSYFHLAVWDGYIAERPSAALEPFYKMAIEPGSSPILREMCYGCCVGLGLATSNLNPGDLEELSRGVEVVSGPYKPGERTQVDRLRHVLGEQRLNA